jgi:acetyl esterase/lipase
MIPAKLRLMKTHFSLAFLALTFFSVSASAASPDVTAIAPDLFTPPVVSGDPMPGKRVFHTLPGYEKSNVRHAIYLPTDWIKGNTYPVIAEFNGNNGTVAGGKAAQGYGISGGRGFIWITLPFVSEDGMEDMDWWWGDPDRTADYAKAAVELICKQFGGNANAVILTGYSRGAIACNYIGLRNDAIAKLWLGMVPVSHYDNLTWKQNESGPDPRVKRLRRLGETPQYVCGELQLATKHEHQRLLALVRQRGFTDIETATRELDLKSIIDQEGISDFITRNHPKARVTFDTFPWVNHDNDWILRDTPSRKRLREWVNLLLADQPSRHKTSIAIPPLLDAVAQKKMTIAGRLCKGPLDVSKVSRVGLAKLAPNDPNRHVDSFPEPVAVKSEEKPVLEKNADGLLLKAESEYAKKEAGLSEFLTSFYIPETTKVRTEVTEEEKSSLRVPLRPADDQLQVHENIIYNKIGQRALVLDLYTPKGIPPKPWPVVIMVHGGGWSKGSHRYMRPLAMSLAAKGFACISVEYRLTGEASFPAAVWDVKAAVRWARKNAKQYNFDTDFITVAGGSAGGNIAGLVGVTIGDNRFEGDGEHLDVSSKVHGVISFDGANGWVGKNWGLTPKKDPWLYNEGVPLFHIIRNNQCPPYLFVGGGELIEAWLKKNIPGSQARFIKFTWPHGFEFFDPAKDQLVTLMADYLHEQQGHQEKKD